MLTLVLTLLAALALLAIAVRILPVVFAALAPPQDLAHKYGRGRWALVTGASGGIGQRLVKRLLAQGFRVVAVSLPDVHAQQEQPEASGDMLTVNADLSDPVAALATVERATHGLDVAVVISNAGSALVAPFEALRSPESVVAHVAANAAAHAAIAQHFYCRMLPHAEPPGQRCRRRGAIVFTSSAMARLPASHAELYCASKAFVERLALALSPAARAHGIDVLAVLPGAVSGTRFLDALTPAQRRVGVLRAVYAVTQSPDAVVDAIFRCVGRVGLVTVGSGLFAVLVSLADGLLSANILSALVGVIVFDWLRPFFASYVDLSHSN